MNERKHRISVVIPVWNQLELARRCVLSIIQGSTEAHQLILVNNGSDKETSDWLKQFIESQAHAKWEVVLIRNETNTGVARAFNQGIRASTGENIAIVNSDIWAMPGWDAALLSESVRLQARMLGPYYDESPFAYASIRARAASFVHRNAGKSRRDWCSVFMLFQRTVFDEIGLFDEAFFVTCEDTDFRERMDQKKMSYYMTGSCYVWHHSKASRECGELPSDYEQKALEVFRKKWGFDPRLREVRWPRPLLRKWRKLKGRLGWF